MITMIISSDILSICQLFSFSLSLSLSSLLFSFFLGGYQEKHVFSHVSLLMTTTKHFSFGHNPGWIFNLNNLFLGVILELVSYSLTALFVLLDYLQFKNKDFGFVLKN